jgi:hypothetical protein
LLAGALQLPEKVDVNYIATFIVLLIGAIMSFFYLYLYASIMYAFLLLKYHNTEVGFVGDLIYDSLKKDLPHQSDEQLQKETSILLSIGVMLQSLIWPFLIVQDK